MTKDRLSTSLSLAVCPSFCGARCRLQLVAISMALLMRTQAQQVFGTVRPTSTCRRVARLVVKGQQIQEQRPAQPQRQVQVPGILRSAGLAAVVNVLAVLPAHADAGKIFDFNLTLPIMATQFLLLMVFLEKTWFTPVGKALDERDANLRAKLGSVKDNSGDLKKLQEEAEQVLREARQAAQAMIKDAKSKTQEEQGKKLAETKEKIDKELETALANLDREKEEALKDLDAQVGKLSGEILARVLPEGVKL